MQFYYHISDCFTKITQANTLITNKPSVLISMEFRRILLNNVSIREIINQNIHNILLDIPI